MCLDKIKLIVLLEEVIAGVRSGLDGCHKVPDPFFFYAVRQMV